LLFPMITHTVNLHKMCRGKYLKGNERNGLGVGGLLPRRWNAPLLHFLMSPKILKKTLTCENSKE
jgi:hypothetical protein